MPSILPENVEKHLKVLTEDIGIRLAGSEGENRAGAYIEEQLRGFGADVHMEGFDIKERAVEEEHLEVLVDGEWKTFACSLLGNARGTDGQTVEAPVAFFVCETDYQNPDLSDLKGKAVVHLGTHIETADYYRRLVEAEPAFVMFVDVRYPGTVATSDGMFPAYTFAYGALSIVSVAYMDAWSWKEKGASRARLRVSGGMRPGSSSNVVAELPGSDPDAGILFVGGHHDTQADSVGADDNGTGVVAVLELTRLLAPIPRRRTIRLISFGAEEQLSVGSAVYVRRHREELSAKGRLMLNFDSFGSMLGWTELSCIGPEEMGQFLNPFFVAAGEYIKLKDELMPYADHFPFAAAGMPSAFLGRLNCASGRFFHHRPDDDLTRIDFELVAKLLDISALCIAELAQADTFPFPTALPDDLQIVTDTMWLELFGGWEGFTL